MLTVSDVILHQIYAYRQKELQFRVAKPQDTTKNCRKEPIIQEKS